MKSRMDRYNATKKKEETYQTEKEIVSTRQHKNQNLYKEVSNAEIEYFDVNSNVSVIGEGADHIDIDQVRDLLDKKYKVDETKDKSIGDSLEEDLAPINLDETREYDLNSVLKQAKSSKEVNYEEDRHRKLHNTQYDILKKLNINKKDIEKEEAEKNYLKQKNMTIEEAESITSLNEIAEEDLKSAAKNRKPDEKELLDLIDTITSKEALIAKEDYPYEEESSSLDPFDLLSDLKGDEDTRVMGAIDLDKMTNTSLNEKEEENEEEEQGETSQDIRLTKNKMFKTTDFEEFRDIKDDMKVTKVLIKILIVILILVLLVGIVFLANKYLELGLF